MMTGKAHSISILGWISLAFWIALGGLRLLEAWQTAHLIPVLLAAQSGLVAWLMVGRGEQSLEVPWHQKIVAWTSALSPLALHLRQERPVSQVVTLLGLLLVLWALWTLGRSFGIAPADRGLVKIGPYRLIRHPMYLGELISLAGAASSNPFTWNIVLVHLLLFALLLRIRWEEQAVSDYEAYARQVRWRLLPGIW
jgi:protein-S-isoprenylcysteine O-methyltransferase Ste14